MDDKEMMSKEEVKCSVCGANINIDEQIINEDSVFCKNCWNKKIRKERNIYSIYGFFVVFILFQLFFYIPALVSEFRGFPSFSLIVPCVIIGTLCGMIAYEEVYARMSRKLI
jgi:predicted nucleic acid-binding Zn ribbon protein